MFHECGAVVSILAVALAMCACGTRYAYAPVTTTSAEVVGNPAADYPFPPEAPRGDVRLATLGLVDVGDSKAIRLRMILTNRGSEPWLLDKSEQQLAVVASEDGKKRTEIVHALTQVAGARVEVPPQQTETVDLFFPLPRDASDPSEVPAFDAIWTVRVGARAIATRTPFERWTVSLPARNVPAAHYPFDEGTPRGRVPDTPDSRGKAAPPVLVPDPTIEPRLP
jgi:hypothetical protein